VLLTHAHRDACGGIPALRDWVRERSAAAIPVYASAQTITALTPRLRSFASGASVLVIDGAMWGRTLFSHLTIDRELPVPCGWRVGRILLTQVGKTASPPARLVRRWRRSARGRHRPMRGLA
jgi:glyoxylase-like metal-dependent hydrolase (beta-lactamase superfamily II)